MAQLVVAQDGGPATSHLRDLLSIVGFDEQVWSELAARDELSEDDVQVALRLAARLRDFSHRQLSDWSIGRWSPELVSQLNEVRGQLVEVAGRARRVSRHQVAPQQQQQLGLAGYYRCRLELTPSSYAILIVPAVPSPWPSGERLDEPVEAQAIFLKMVREDDQLLPVMVASRLHWYPDELNLAGVRRGHLTLAQLGMDIGLLDEVRHRRPFVGRRVSREGEAFYALLAAVRQAPSGSLRRQADTDLPEYRAAWSQRAASLREQMRALAAAPGEAEKDPAAAEEELNQLRDQLLLAEEVERQLARGRYSVAPLFNEPDRHVGSLLLIEGVARRAIRIATDVGRQQSALPSGERIDHYFEVDVFTDDSQNNPVVLCVRELPAGFPTGDRIAASVRVAAFFFKNWQYAGRAVGVADETARGVSNRRLAPLLVGDLPVQVAPVAAKSNELLGLWLGMGFLGLLAVIWWGLWTYSRGDREFRRRWIAADRPSTALPDKLPPLDEENPPSATSER